MDLAIHQLKEDIHLHQEDIHLLQEVIHLLRQAIHLELIHQERIHRALEPIHLLLEAIRRPQVLEATLLLQVQDISLLVVAIRRQVRLGIHRQVELVIKPLEVTRPLQVAINRLQAIRKDHSRLALLEHNQEVLAIKRNQYRLVPYQQHQRFVRSSALFVSETLCWSI